MATDFLSIDAIASTFDVAMELSADNIANPLNPHAMLWHAWVSMQEITQDSMPFRPQRKRRPKTVHIANQNRVSKQIKRDVTLEKYTYACPDIACRTSLAKFKSISGVASHMYVMLYHKFRGNADRLGSRQVHHLKVTDDEISKVMACEAEEARHELYASIALPS